MVGRALALLLALAFLAGCAPDGPPAVIFQEDGDGYRVEAVQLDSKLVAAVRRAELSEEDWRRFFPVTAQPEGVRDERPAMLGSYEVDGRVFRFTPRFPLAAGMTYRARLDVAGLAAFVRTVPKAGARAFHEAFLVLPAEDRPPTRVTAIHPTATRVPENLLRLYVHFSAPMSRGEAWERIHLFRGEEKLGAAFVEIEQELWDGAQQRLTVLFDPGRIKRGLRPHEELGPPLADGERYRLVIDGGWLDAHGQPLEAAFEKVLEVGPADRTPPDPENWKLTAPAAGGRDAVVLAFPEPLDDGLLRRLLRVVGADGEAVEGEVETADEEQRWTFTPSAPWAAGDYAVEVDTLLEDLAGNNLRQAFDVDLQSETAPGVDAETVTLSFTVR